ncbi:MAG: hypothetical protein KF886_15025 [Candidatus Hydrogenedentes bacterium]|nr:hypothetical protein [Candidatus Hydrogenedentota bacterium]
MNKTDAVAAMGDIESSQKRTRARAHYKGADIIYVLWGALWIAAFTTQHLGRDFHYQSGNVSIHGMGMVWLPLVLLGIVLTLVIARGRESVVDKDGWKFGILWPVVFAYVYLWIFLLGPLFNESLIQSPDATMRFTAVFSTVPMCIYVLGGILNSQAYIACIGAIVTALTAIGFYFAYDYFYLWMAFFGGGGLIAAGYISRRKWQRA